MLSVCHSSRSGISLIMRVFPSLRDPSKISQWDVSGCDFFSCRGADGSYRRTQEITTSEPVPWKKVMQFESFTRVTVWQHEGFHYHLYLLDHVQPSKTECIWKIGYRIPSARDMKILWQQRLANKHVLPTSDDGSPVLTYWEQVTDAKVKEVQQMLMKENHGETADNLLRLSEELSEKLKDAGNQSEELRQANMQQ